MAAAVAAGCLVGMPGAARAVPGTSEGDVRLADPRITESSGLALSRAHPHTVWTVNDSGDSARLFAVDTRTGETVGLRTFDAPVRDVEALAITSEGRMLDDCVRLSLVAHLHSDDAVIELLGRRPCGTNVVWIA